MGERFNLTAQLQLQAPTNTRQVISQIRSQLQGVNVDVRVQANTRTLTQVNRSLADINGSARNAATSFGFLNRNLSEAARRFGVITLATGTMLSFAQSVKRAVGDAIAFERQMVTLSQVTGNTVKQLEGVSQEVTRLSVSLGASSKELLSVAVTLAQAGFSADETRKSLDILAKTTLGPSFENVTETVEGAIAAVRQFSEEAAAAGGTVKFLEATLDSINSVSKAFAVESSDLITVIRRTGGVFAAAGGSINELIALFTSVRATTRESAETIATGLRTIFTRIQRTETVQQLESLGIALRDAEGKFVGAFEAVRRLSVGLSALDPRDVRFSAIVEELGGFRQIGKVIPLIQQFAVAQDALNVAQAASGSVAQDAVTAQQALAVQAQKVSEQFSALIRQLANSSTFREIASGALELASALIKIASALEPVLPLLTSFLALKVGQGLAPGLTALLGFGGARRRASGGVIRKYARGGFVPGTGNRDTVPAMLQPGEFVIRKSSVNKIGAANLAAMNENGYAAGGQIKLRPGAIGGFFLQPEKGIDRNLNLDFNAGINNPKVLSQLGLSSIGSAQTRNQAFANLSKDQQAKILFGSAAVREGKNLKSKIDTPIFNQNGSIKKQLGFGQDVTNATQDPKFLKRLDNATKRGVTKLDKTNVNVSGPLASFFPGGKDDTTSAIANIVTRNTIRGLESSVRGAVQPVANLLNNPIINFDESRANKAASTISGDPNARKTTEGFIFEGLIQGITGATLSGNQSSFDFPASSVASAKDSLAAMFGPNIPSLVKADAKRTNTRDAIDSIKSKITNDINAGRLEGLDIIKKNLGGLIQRFAKGSSGKGVESGKGILPRPGFAIADIIKAGGGFVDIDRTLLRTVGDIAYGKARTDAERNAVLKKYFLDPKERLKDIQSVGLTQFGKELQSSIKSGKLDGRKVKVVSKSTEVEGLRQYLSGLFGIPSDNMKFTSGSSKVPFIRGKGPLVDDIPDNARFASGGGVGTDTVPALLTPGEFVINKKSAQSIGYGSLNRMNKVGKYAKGGAVGVQKFADGGKSKDAIYQEFVPMGGSTNKFLAALDKVTFGLLDFGGTVLRQLVTGTTSASSQMQAFDYIIQQAGTPLTGVANAGHTLLAALEENGRVNNRTARQQELLAHAFAQELAFRAETEDSVDYMNHVIDKYIKALQDDTEAKKQSSQATKRQTAATNVASGSTTGGGGGSTGGGGTGGGGGGRGGRGRGGGGGVNQTAESLNQALGVAQQFVFLGSTVAALTSSMSGLSDVQQQAITETAGFVTGIVGVVGTVGQLIASVVAAATANTASAATEGIESVASAASATADGAETVLSSASAAADGVEAVGSTVAAAADTAEAGASGAAGVAMTAFAAAILAAIVVIVAIAAVYKYQAALARAQADELKKAADAQIEALSNLTGSTEEFIRLQQEQVAKSNTAAQRDASTSGALVGGAAGAVMLGSIFGPIGLVVGAAVGALIGGMAAEEKERQRQIEIMARFGKELTLSSRILAETTKRQAQFKQALQDIDLEKNLTPETRVQRRLQAQSGVTNVASGNITESNRQLQRLATEKGKSVGELSEEDFKDDAALKVIFLNAQKSLAKNLELLSQSVAESRETLQEAAKIEITGDASFAEIIASGGQLAQAFAMSQAAIQAETASRIATLQAQLATAKDEKVKQDLQKAINTETQRGAQRLRDQTHALEQQAEEQKKLKAELIATAAANAAFRQRMLEINAIADGLVNVDNALNKLEKSASNLSSLLSGDKLDFSLDAPEGLDNLENVGDVGTFNKGIDAIAASMGAAGPKLAASTKRSVDIIQRMNKSQIIGKQFQPTEAAPTADQFLAEMGLKQADLGNEIYQKFKEQFGKLSEDQIISPEDAQELFNPILEEGRRSAGLLAKYNEQQNRAIGIYQSFVSQLKDQTDKEIEARQKLVSLVAKTEELRAKARGTELTSGQKEAFRQQEAQIPLTGLRDLAGNQLQAGNVEQLSATRAAAFAERASIEADVKAGKATADRAKREIELNNIIEKTSAELNRLTDQGERAADILGELDKERQKKEVGKSLVEDFVVGGADQRNAINQAFAGVQAAIKTGTIQNQTPEQRKSTFDLLDKFKDIPAFNVGGGRKATGATIKEEIIKRDAVRLGLDPKVLQLLYGQTDKEKELIAALDRLTDQIRGAGGANVAFEQQKTEAARQRADQAARDLSATGTARTGQPPLPPTPPGQPAAGPQQQFAAGAAVAGGRAAVQQVQQQIGPPVAPVGAGGAAPPAGAGAAPPAGAGAAPPVGAGAGVPQTRAEMLAQRAAQAEQDKQDRKKRAIEDKEARKAAFAQTPLGKAQAALKAKKDQRRADENAAARAKGKQVELTPDDLARRQQLTAQLMGQQDITSASGLSSVTTTPTPATTPAPAATALGQQIQQQLTPPHSAEDWAATVTLANAVGPQAQQQLAQNTNYTPPHSATLANAVGPQAQQQLTQNTNYTPPAPTTTVAATPTAPTGPMPIDATGLNDVFNTFVGNFSSSLDNIVQRFSGIESAFGSLTQALTGITMTHTVTVEGLISVGGLNVESIKQELSSSIGQMVAQEIKTKMDEEGRRFKV